MEQEQRAGIDRLLASEMEEAACLDIQVEVLSRILVSLRECPPGVQEQACIHPDAASPPWPKDSDSTCMSCWKLWVQSAVRE